MHTADTVSRVMRIRAEVIRQLAEDKNSPLRPPGDKMLLRENEAIVAQYTLAACQLDAVDDLREIVANRD